MGSKIIWTDEDILIAYESGTRGCITAEEYLERAKYEKRNYEILKKIEELKKQLK